MTSVAQRQQRARRPLRRRAAGVVVVAARGVPRRRLAQVCGVPPHRLALSENVTSGCVLPLWGLPIHEGDHILISDCEHPGVVAACLELARRQRLTVNCLPVRQLRGGRNDQAETDAAVLEALEQHLTPNACL